MCRGFGPIVLGSVWLACGLTPLRAHAQESTAPVTFDIPSQPLARALNSWAVQAGAQLFFEQVPAAGHTAPAVGGSRAPREALHALLAHSGLDFMQDEGGAFVVRPVAARRGDRDARGVSAGVYSDSRRIVFVTGDERPFRSFLLLPVPALGVQW